MGTMRRAIAIVAAVVLAATAAAGGHEHDITWLIPEAKARVSDNFDWQHKGPLEFIDHLKRHLESNTIPIYTVWSYHRGWIQESDLPALRALLDSTEPCAALKSPLSSYISPKGSTVGVVAKELIAGFKAGGFPTWNADAVRLLGK